MLGPGVSSSDFEIHPLQAPGGSASTPFLTKSLGSQWFLLVHGFLQGLEQGLEQGWTRSQLSVAAALQVTD